MNTKDLLTLSAKITRGPRPTSDEILSAVEFVESRTGESLKRDLLLLFTERYEERLALEEHLSRV